MARRCSLDTENEIATEGNADKRTVRVGMRGREVRDRNRMQANQQRRWHNKRHEGDSVTKDTEQPSTSLRTREVRRGVQYTEGKLSKLDSPPSTEASPRSRQESDPRPLGKNHTKSLLWEAGHNKDRLRYQPTERRSINSTNPTIPPIVYHCASALWNWPGQTRGNDLGRRRGG